MTPPSIEENPDLLAGARVLAVDDTPANLNVINQVFAPYDVDLSIAMSGEEAIELVRDIAPEVILMDVMMPGLDGMETCRRIRAMPELHDPPIIFVTASPDDAQKAFDAGGVDYVIKPIRHGELLARVGNHLTLHRHRRRAGQDPHAQLRLQLQPVIEEIQRIAGTLEGRGSDAIRADLQSVSKSLGAITRQ